MDGNALAPYFYRGLKDAIKDLLVGQEEWRTFEELQDRASRLDACLQARKIEKEQDMRARAAPPPVKTETKPAFSPKPAFIPPTPGTAPAVPLSQGVSLSGLPSGYGTATSVLGLRGLHCELRKTTRRSENLSTARQAPVSGLTPAPPHHGTGFLSFMTPPPFPGSRPRGAHTDGTGQPTQKDVPRRT